MTPADAVSLIGTGLVIVAVIDTVLTYRNRRQIKAANDRINQARLDEYHEVQRARDAERLDNRDPFVPVSLTTPKKQD